MDGHNKAIEARMARLFISEERNEGRLGAIVSGAKIMITRIATGETRTALTNQAGEYIFPLIEIGEYTVRCEMQGFKTQSVTGLTVEVQQKARVNFSLEVGDLDVPRS